VHGTNAIIMFTSLQAQFTVRRLHASYVTQTTYFVFQPLQVGYSLPHF